MPLPNPPHRLRSEGSGPTQTRRDMSHGDPVFFDFPVLDHVDLGERLGILDMDRGAKVFRIAPHI